MYDELGNRHLLLLLELDFLGLPDNDVGVMGEVFNFFNEFGEPVFSPKGEREKMVG